MAPVAYAKTKSRSTMKGDWYEVKVAALLFLRSKNSRLVSRFQLATNVEGAGALDDIVYRWLPTTGTPTWHTSFVQLKHKERALLRVGSFTGTKGDFSLKRYLTSFADIKRAKLEGVCDNQLLLNGSLGRFQLIIYTNANVENVIVKRKVRSDTSECIERPVLEELLRSNRADELIFRFNRETDEEVFSCLEDEASRDDVTEFFEKLTVFTGQPPECDLDDLIKKELLIACGGAVTDAGGAIYRIFEGLFKQWWRDSNDILDENSDVIQRAVYQLSSEAELTKQTERCTLGLNFDESVWKTFNTGFSEDHVTLLHVVTSEACLRLSATKLLQLLHAEKLSFTFTSLEYLLKHQRTLIPDWRDGYKDCLVVLGNSLERECQEQLIVLGQDISEVLHGHSNKKTIVVSRNDCQFATHLKDKNQYRVLVDRFDIADLDESSQTKIFESEVWFQGHKLSWKILYESDVNFWRSLFSDTLIESLLTKDKITIGAKLPRAIQHFIPRRLVRHCFLDKEVLRSDVLTDVFAVSLGTLQDERQFVDTLEIEQKARIMVMDTNKAEDEYQELCAASSQVHWLHLEDDTLKWMQSKSNISTIKQFILAIESTTVQSETVAVNNDKVVLVIAEPGMGKTTLMLTLAQTAKKANPADWIIQINLRDHSELFNQSPQFCAFDFLTTALHMVSPLEKAFLRESLDKTGNIVIMLDSFDEICPRYEIEGCALVASILKTRVRKVVVTSRHCMQDMLEKQLSTLAYNIVEFSEDDQKMFFRNFWAQSSTPMSPDQLELFIAQLIDSVNYIDPDKQLMQVPLQTMMLAEVFHDHVMDPENNALPETLDMLNLFEQFVEKKFTIFFRKGYNNLNRHDSKCAFLENHQQAALMLFVPEHMIQNLKSKQNIVANADVFLTNIERATYNSGLVISVVNKKPVFLHQMFAEYFAGMWFAEHYQSNREFLKEFIFRSNYSVIRVMFDRILCKGMKLHAAVLDADTVSLEGLLALQDGSVDALDEGGRSLLHLAAALAFVYPDIDSSYRVNERFVGPRRKHTVELLLEHGATTMNVKDDVFHWTPLQYACKNSSWDATEYLLDIHEDNEHFTLTTDVTDQTLLDVVFSYGFINLLTLLLDHGLPVNCSSSHFPKSLLHYASQYGYTEIVELLLSRGADKRALDYNRNVPLHIASRFGHLLVVRTLIHSKESLTTILNFKNKIKFFRNYVNTLNSEKDTPLHFAMTSAIVSLLVAHGADMWIRGKHKKTCLHTFAWYGKLSAIEELLKKLHKKSKDVEKYVNFVDNYGMTALYYASTNGHPDIIRLLVSHGAHVRTVDRRGRTSLHYATSNVEALTIIQSLREEDDEGLSTFIDVIDTEGRTALVLAAISMNPDKIRLLASHGANVWARDNLGRTSLHYATEAGVVEALIDSLGDGDKDKYVNAVDSVGCSALIVVCRGGQTGAIEPLLRHGANVWAVDARGRTGLHLAAESGCFPVAKTLVESLGDKRERLLYVTNKDHNGHTASDVATLSCHMDRYTYYKDARVDLACWLDGIVDDMLKDISKDNESLKDVVGTRGNV